LRLDNLKAGEHGEQARAKVIGWAQQCFGSRSCLVAMAAHQKYKVEFEAFGCPHNILWA